MEYYILFEGIIDQSNSKKLADAILAIATLNNPPIDKIHILMSSMGGNIYHGFSLAAIIKNSKVPVAIHATNEIDSIANVIFVAAKERTAESYAKFYMHGSTSAPMGFDVKGLLEQLSSVKTHNSRTTHFMSENTGLPLEKIQKMMRVGASMSAQEALNLGWISAIVHKEVPVGALRYDIISI